MIFFQQCFQHFKPHNALDDSLKMKYPQDKTPRISLKPVVFKVTSEYLIRFLSIGNGKKIISKLKFNMP